MRFLPLLLLALPLVAQSFAGAYITGLPQSSPKPTGGYFIAAKVSGNNLWSITGQDYTVTAQRQIQGTTWSGVGTQCKVLTFATFYCYAAPGDGLTGKPAGGTSSGFTLTAGGTGVFPIKKGALGNILAGLAVLTNVTGVSNTSKVVHLGWGKSW